MLEWVPIKVCSNKIMFLCFVVCVCECHLQRVLGRILPERATVVQQEHHEEAAGGAGRRHQARLHHAQPRCAHVPAVHSPSYTVHPHKHHTSYSSYITIPKTYRFIKGVPQGSGLGTLLWNIMYDGLLNLPLPDGAELCKTHRGDSQNFWRNL